MCLGVPMKVVESTPGQAICELDGERRQVNTLLVGEQPSGTWLLVFLDSAREVLSEEEARQLRDALVALDAVMHGDDNIDHLFADLVDHEPQLPEQLRPTKPG
jgi:hydrogenase expression/formation protein HypC